MWGFRFGIQVLGFVSVGSRVQGVINVECRVQGSTLELGVHTHVGPLWKGYHESTKCSRNTYPESHITKYTSIRRLGLGDLEIEAHPLVKARVLCQDDPLRFDLFKNNY